MNLNASSMSFLPWVIGSEKEKLKGPTGVKNSTAIPMEDLILLSSAKDEL